MNDLFEELEKYAQHLDQAIVDNENQVVMIDRDVELPSPRFGARMMVAAAAVVALAGIGYAAFRADGNDVDVADTTTPPVVATTAPPAITTPPAINTTAPPVIATTAPRVGDAQPDRDKLIRTRDALQRVADAITRGDESAALAMFAPDAVVTGPSLWGSLINDGRIRALDVTSERVSVLTDIQMAIVLQSTPTFDSCINGDVVTCEWSIQSDIFRPGNVDDTVSVTVQLDESGLISSWAAGTRETDTAELSARVWSYLIALDGDLVQQCVESEFEGDGCVEFVADGVAGFWESNSAATAETVIMSFATAVASGDVETARSLVSPFARTDGRILGEEVADISNSSLVLVDAAVDTVTAATCNESEMEAARRVSTCTLSLQTASGPREVSATVTVIDGLIHRWSE